MSVRTAMGQQCGRATGRDGKFRIASANPRAAGCDRILVKYISIAGLDRRPLRCRGDPYDPDAMRADCGSSNSAQRPAGSPQDCRKVVALGRGVLSAVA
jgi:hypothetical protein